MEKFETSIGLVSGETPGTVRYRITDYQGNSTVITSKRMAELQWQAMGGKLVPKSEAVAVDARLSALFVKEIRAAKKSGSG